MRSILVTGGAGFIGSAVCRSLVRGGHRVINVDKLTYSGTLESLRDVDGEPGYRFHQADVCDGVRLLDIMRSEEIDGIMHLAAESHVDRSIDGPAVFLDTNVVGTFRLLDAALTYWRGLTGAKARSFRFHHVSTDEVFGDLPFDDAVFTEETAYAPSSPYSATKAASDHLVRAWHHTYGLPVLISNCGNNFGPYQHPEKLIPLTILHALAGQPLPVYGTGANVRDWIHVDDHVHALELVFLTGQVGQSYNIGSRAERTNLRVVETICDILDRKRPLHDGQSRRELVTFVTDRPGHDRRYAIDPSKIERELGWKAGETFESGIERTTDWYVEHEWWWRPIIARQSHHALGISP